MTWRLLIPTLFVATGLTGPAIASSFVLLEQAKAPVSPSIIYFGEPEPDTAADEAAAIPARPSAIEPETGSFVASAPLQETGSIISISPSVVAMGEPAVERMIVASISSKPARDPHAVPLVMRGGILGDAYLRAGDGEGSALPAPAEAEAEQLAPATASARRNQPARNDTPAPSAPPEPALPPPAAPTGRPE